MSGQYGGNEATLNGLVHYETEGLRRLHEEANANNVSDGILERPYRRRRISGWFVPTATDAVTVIDGILVGRVTKALESE